MGRDWEVAYQSGDTPWDKGEAAPPLLEMLDRLGPQIWQGGPVVVPGCGVGHDVRVIASAGIEVVGLDIAPSAIVRAESFPKAGEERYVLGDFLEDEAGERYAGLWEHTCFCAILPEQRDAYAMAAARSVKPGGVLAGVFYLTPSDSGEPDDGPPFGGDVESIKSHLGPWFECENGWVPERSYSGREGREWIGLFRRLFNDDGL